MKKRQLYLQWDSTNKCNLKCLQCYHPNHVQAQNQMKLEEVKEMLDDLRDTAKRWSMIPRISISGGEPLLREDLPKILDYTNRNEIITAILTNGTLLTSQKAEEIYDAGVRRIQISIDGKRETHNKIRGKSFAYDKSLEGITNASAAGIDVTVSMTLMKSNQYDFEEVIKAAIKTGAKKVGFKTYVPDKALGMNDPEYINAEGALLAFKEAGRLIEKYSNNITVLTSDVLWKIIEPSNLVKEIAMKEDKYLTGCSAGYRALSVLSDGTVYPCRRLPIPIGNIKEGIVNLIVNNNIMQELRDLGKMERNAQCNKVSHCRGCRAVAYAVTGDFMAKDPMCFKHLLGEKDDKY
jgi:AdoMet-dependent heme synthase